MAIMSALSLSSLVLPRWRRDVTSSGGMAVPTFHVTTVIQKPGSLLQVGWADQEEDDEVGVEEEVVTGTGVSLG